MTQQLITQTGAGSAGFVEKMLTAVESFEKAKELGQFIINSGFAPKHFDNPEMVVLAIDAGKKLGLDWFQSLQEGFIVNGIPGYKGKILKALVLANPVCERWDTEFTGDLKNETRTCIITYKRKGQKEQSRSYSTDMAKMAGLWGKKRKFDKVKNQWVEYEDVWCKFPEDMLEWKTVSRVLNDFADITKGFRPIEDLVDYKQEEDPFVTQEGIVVDSKPSGKGEAMNQAALGALQAAKPTTPKVRKSKPAEPAQQQTIDVEATDVTSVSEKEYAITDTVVYTQEQLVAMSNAGLLSLTSKVMGFDVDVELFPTEEKKKNRTKANLVNLILAKQDDTSEDMLKSVFGYDLRGDNSLGAKNDSPQGKDLTESPKTTYHDAPEEGRPFETCLEMSDSLAAGGVEEDDIMAFIQSNGLPYVDTESFFKFATGAMIDKLTEEHSN